MVNRDNSDICCIPARLATIDGGSEITNEQRRYASDHGFDRNDTQRVELSSKASSAVPNRRVASTDIDTVAIAGGWFDMGSTDSAHPEDGEGPIRSVWVDEFQLATTAVSNRDFQIFVDATNYQTDAEHVGSSFVFHLLLEDATLTPASGAAPWWRNVSGACWHSPEGSGSSINDRWDHPVVHITRSDAMAFCRWSDKRLPTEAEWERAARGGLLSQAYPWGAILRPDGEHRCNIWQGEFPNANTVDDGFVGTAPVTQFTANAFGLFNMTGNVWEWVADRFTNMHSPRPVKNPTGPLNGERFVARGGSYLCHESYCLRYRTSSRQALVNSASAGNLGFRVAADG